MLKQIKQRISFAQQKAMFAANEELLRMNWDIGEMLVLSQKADGWGKKTLQRLAVDLKNEYPEKKGFSVRNMQCMMQFYQEYNKELTWVKMHNYAIAQPSVAQLEGSNKELPIKHLSWTHNIILIQRVKDIKARYWYMIQCITSHWSKEYLTETIKLDYYGKHGALANNFATTLPAKEAQEVQSLLKDPYIFEVSGDDYYIDMLMYNTFMHRYLVIELKATDFMPEYIGKLNFYCSAIDDTLCREGDNKTIGLLLCKTKDRIKAEYALRDIQKPIGVSDYELGQALPKDFRSSLPSIEEIEKGLNEWNQE